jgi:hypothetical protein
MSEQDKSNPGGNGGESPLPEYGPTYYAPVEMPLPRLPRPPFWMVSLALIMIVATWLPLAIIARARESTSTEPRIQLVQDMGEQPKFREQMTNPLFADDREMRPKIPGTVARGELFDDVGMYRGFIRVHDPYSNTWTVRYLDIPRELGGSPQKWSKLLKRGQQRFNIYCYVCHGYDGSGHGPVNERAAELRADGVSGMSWTNAAVLTSATIRAEADGQIFNTITNGIRSMPSYGAQVPPADRWAIVAYVRALQLSQSAPESLLSKAQRDVLQGK